MKEDKKENEEAQIKIDADIAAYLESGGIVDTIPTGHSGEVKRQMVQRNGKTRYKNGESGDGWKKADRARYDLRAKKEGK